MSKIAELKTKGVRRWFKLNGAFWVVRMTCDGIIAKPYKKHAKSSIIRSWRDILADPNEMSLFRQETTDEPPKNAADGPAQATAGKLDASRKRVRRVNR